MFSPDVILCGWLGSLHELHFLWQSCLVFFFYTVFFPDPTCSVYRALKTLNYHPIFTRPFYQRFQRVRLSPGLSCLSWPVGSLPTGQGSPIHFGMGNNLLRSSSTEGERLLAVFGPVHQLGLWAHLIHSPRLPALITGIFISILPSAYLCRAGQCFTGQSVVFSLSAPWLPDHRGTV